MAISPESSQIPENTKRRVIVQNIAMFDPVRNVESDVDHPEHCPVGDRELTAIDSTPIVRCLVERRLVDAPDIDILRPSESPRAWPARDPVESAAQYLFRVPTRIVGAENFRREADHDVPVTDDSCPVETAELECISSSPLATMLLQARRDGRYDRCALAPRYAGEDWPERLPGESADGYLVRAARQMLGAVYVRAEAMRTPESHLPIPSGETIN